MTTDTKPIVVSEDDLSWLVKCDAADCQNVVLKSKYHFIMKDYSDPTNFDSKGRINKDNQIRVEDTLDGGRCILHPLPRF